MINRGPKNNEKRLPFIKKIPDENWSEGLCLPLSIVLAANIERGKINGEDEFTNQGLQSQILIGALHCRVPILAEQLGWG